MSYCPPLGEEIERALRLRAWKDEIFREALIADPKGVIQSLFPQCFPDGKVPEQLTIKVIEEDPDTHHIVIPSLSDEFATPEIPEEEQLELLVHMGALGRMDSSDNKGQSQPSEKSKRDFSRDQFYRQSKENREPNLSERPRHASSTKQEKAGEPPTLENLPKAVREKAKSDKKFLQELFANPNDAIQQHFPGVQLPENLKLKAVQPKPGTHEIYLPPLPDKLGAPGIPRKAIEKIGKPDGNSDGCTDPSYCNNHTDGCAAPAA